MKSTVLLSTFLLGLSSTLVLSQGPGQDGPPPKDPLAEALDTNRDGVISESEMENAAEALATLDQNKDGELDREELKPPHPPAPDEENGKRSRRSKRKAEQEDRRRPSPPLVQALDRNRDGKISSHELRRAERVLKRLDRNRDHQLSGEELHPPHPNGGPPPGGAGGRR